MVINDNMKKNITNADYMKNSFLNDGLLFDEEKKSPIYGEDGEALRVPLKDFITSEDLKPFMKTVISTFLVEAIQPALLIVPNLCTIVRTNGMSQVVQIKALEDVKVGIVARGGDFETTTLGFDNLGISTAAVTQRVGAKLIVEKEIVDNDQFGLINLWISAAGKALARFKETQALKKLGEYGKIVFDNLNPVQSVNGITNGLSAQLTPNGTFTMEDLHRMYAYLLERGFNGDTLIIHPLAWQVLNMDPIFGQNVLKNGVLSYPQIPMGTPASGFPDPFMGRGVNSRGKGTLDGSSPFVQTITPVGANYTATVNQTPVPMKVLVSHFVPFTTVNTAAGTKYVTSIILVDSTRALILYQSEDPKTKEGFVEENETYWVIVQEKYGFGIWSQGEGIAVANNVFIDKNYNFTTVNQQTLAPINPNVPIPVI